MQTIAVFVACLAVANAASSIVRVPSADSAVIESHRLGGSFAYSTSEGHAVGIVNPVVQNVVSPVATSYSTVSGLPISTLNLNNLYSNAQLRNVVVPQSQQLNNVVLPQTQLNNVALSQLGVSQLGVNQLGVNQLGNLQVIQGSQLGNVAFVRSGNVVSNINGVQLSNLQLQNLHNLGLSSVVV